MYFPERLRTSPAAAGLPEAQEISLATRDRETVIVWYVPPRGEKPVALYFPGNGGAPCHRVARFRAVIADGNGLITLSYRGYGGSTGTPTEAGLIADAEAAYAFASARYPAERIVLWVIFARFGRRSCACNRSQGRPHRAGRIVHLRCRCGGARVLVLAGLAFHEGSVSLRPPNCKGNRAATIPARNARSGGANSAGGAAIRARQ